MTLPDEKDSAKAQPTADPSAQAGDGPRTPQGADTAGRDAALAQSITRALDAQRAFVSHRPTKIGRGFDSLTAPLSNAMRGMIPASVLRNALRGTDAAAGLTLPSGPVAHDLDDIDACEAAALTVQKWSAGSNAATGGAAGFLGGLGLTLDIPATLSLAARNVRATGAAYGFGTDTEDERAFRLMILELAAVRGLEARADSLDRVNRLARQLSNPLVRAAVGRGSDWLMETVVERVARQLGISLLQRKAAQLVPVLGGIVAATVNAGFQTDVSRAARYAYRQRWLMARRMLPLHDDPATPDAPSEPPLAEGDAST